MRPTHSRLMVMGIVCVVPVLICMMGAGVLLYIVAQNSSAEVAQLTQRQHTATQWQEKIQSLRQRIAQMEEQLREVDRRLAEAQKAQSLQQQIAQLQQEKQRLQQERERLRNQCEALQSQAAAKAHELEKLQQEVAQAQARLAHLLQKIREMQPGPSDPHTPDPGATLAELRSASQSLQEKLERQKRMNEQKQAELDRLQEELTSNRPRFKIQTIRGSEQWQVPPNPLYVECDGQGIVLQPENQRLPSHPNTEQEDHFLRVVRERKYVLFLIRPNGFQSFRKYRGLLEEKAEEIDYGYEPIPQDAVVDYRKE